jgi:hypothetical protein
MEVLGGKCQHSGGTYSRCPVSVTFLSLETSVNPTSITLAEEEGHDDGYYP